MSTPTSLGDVEIEAYLEAVRSALADLPPEVRDDLIEDLPDHLAEVAAEGDATLRERLGEPAAYAAELCAAAGLDPVAAGRGGRGDTMRAEVLALWRRAGVQAARADRQLGRMVGYPRVRDLLAALAPGWWVLRGWLVAQALCQFNTHFHWPGALPRLNGSLFLGTVVALVAVVTSVWAGRRSRSASSWPRGGLIALNVAVCVWLLGVLVGPLSDGVGAYFSGSQSASYVDAPTAPYVDDLYVYDQQGNLVPGARLYDQDGNPVNLGADVCADGSPADGDVNDYDGSGSSVDGTVDPADGVGEASEPARTYPVCPRDGGPFRAGPGPVTGSAGAPTTSGASGAVTSGSAVTGGATPASGARPASGAPATEAPTSRAPAPGPAGGSGTGSAATPHAAATR